MLCIRYRLNIYAANKEPFLLIIHMKHPVLMLVNHPKTPTKTGVQEQSKIVSRGAPQLSLRGNLFMDAKSEICFQ